MPRKKIERYYYNTSGFNNDTCVEECMIKNNGVMIGSVMCQNCFFCKDHSDEDDLFNNWIKCSRINEAIIE